MVNHVRTLLLNQVASAGVPGEEYTPPAFRPRRVDPAMAVVRGVLFGATPDRHMRNYRGRQLMGFVHACPLADHAHADDPRVTYPVPGDAALFPPALFAPAGRQLAGPPAPPLHFLGRPEAPDATGVVYRAYDVAVGVGGLVTVTSPQGTVSNPVFNPDDGPVPLPGSGYSFRPPTLATGAAWAVEVANRPQWDCGDLLATLGAVGEPTLVALFGLTTAEPYASYRNLFAATEAGVPARLAAAALALARRTGESEVA